MSLLVGILNRAGRAHEAEAEIRASIEILRPVLAEDSFQFAYAESMLGDNLAEQGRYLEAEPLLLRSHELIIEHMDNAPVFAVTDSLHRMIRLYEGWGRQQQAAPYRDALTRACCEGSFVQPWPIARLVFGEDPEMQQQLDAMYALCGGFEYSPGESGPVQASDVDPLLANVLALRETSFGAGDPRDTVLARHLGGWSHSLAEGAGEARETMLTTALPGLRRARDAQPRELADGLAQLSMLARGRDPERADLLVQEAYEVLQDVREADSWYTATTKYHLARALIQAGRFEEAESVLLPAHEVLVTQLRPNHRHTRLMRGLLHQLYRSWGKPDEAAHYEEEREDR